MSTRSAFKTKLGKKGILTYCLDTNIVIYAINDILLEGLPAGKFLVPASVRVEVLGYPKISQSEALMVEEFFSLTEIVSLSDEICDAAILLRRNYGLRLGDALMAATALHRDAILLSNDRGVRRIREVSVQQLAVKPRGV